MPTRRTNIKGKTGTRKVATVVPLKRPTPLTHRYLYVEARGWFDPTYLPKVGEVIRQENVFGGDPISFADVIVRARSIEDAYVLGAAAMGKLETESPTAHVNHFAGQFLNDYVVKL